MIEKSLADVHIVAHRYNKILNSKKLKYSIIKNIGLEFGAYDWYIKNIWDKKSNIVFMHDDIVIDKTFNFNDLFKLSKGKDYVVFRNDLKISGGGRCIYLSNKLISLLVSEYNGIWFDANDRGYIWGDKGFYDEIYYKLGKKEIWKDKIGINFKMTISYLIKKHHLKRKDIVNDKISLCIRGGKKKDFSKIFKSNFMRLSDHSVLCSSESNGFNKNTIMNSYKREKEDYCKWYDFYFSKIKFENFNILKIGYEGGDDLKVWKKYFINSNVYGINGEDVKKEYLQKLCNKIPFGVDIVIDSGRYLHNRISIFENLFGNMNPGGIFVLENLIERYKNKNNDIINYFKEKIDTINFSGLYQNKSYEEIIYNDDKKIGFFEKRICSIHFYMGFCFVFKRYCK